MFPLRTLAGLRGAIGKVVFLSGLVLLCLSLAYSFKHRTPSIIVKSVITGGQSKIGNQGQTEGQGQIRGQLLQAKGHQLITEYTTKLSSNYTHNGAQVLIGNRSLSASTSHTGGVGRKMFQYLGVTNSTTSNRTPTENQQSLPGIDTTPKILCWILTDPKDLEKRTRHVRDTWAKRCDVTLFMSSAQNDSFPTIGLKVLPGRNHIASKAKAAWSYIYKHHLNDADFFVKADPDTYIVIENMKEYLSHENPNAMHYYGHRFNKAAWGFTYMSGGPGLILTRKSVEKLVTSAFKLKPNCMPDGTGEDWKTAKCLSLVGGKAIDTRDKAGRERFMVFKPSDHISGRFPKWYLLQDTDGGLKGAKCCSDYPISFHYIKPEEMPVLDYFLYHARPHGKETIRLQS